jgi:hypothetical protein
MYMHAAACLQTARKIHVAKFRAGKVGVLITTDVAARGIDIPLIDNVINYDFPAKPELFVHRWVFKCSPELYLYRRIAFRGSGLLQSMMPQVHARYRGRTAYGIHRPGLCVHR